MLDEKQIPVFGLYLPWSPEAPTLPLAAGLVIAVSFLSIPVTAAAFAYRNRAFAFTATLYTVMALVIGGAALHLSGMFWPQGDDSGVAIAEAVAAIMSFGAALVLWRLRPVSPAGDRRLAAANRALAAEIGERLQSDARYSNVFNSLGEPLHVVTVRPDGGFTFDLVNPAHAKALGLSPEVMRGRPVEEVLPADLARAIVARYRACVDAGEPIDIEEELPLPRAVRIWHTVLVPIHDAEGRIVQVLGSDRDVTERRRLQGDLVRASKLATLGAVSAGMAHEVSQPLNIIRIWAESALDRLAKGEVEPERMQKVLSLIVDQAERMGSILDRIRLFSRHESIAAEDLDAATCVATAVGLLRTEYALEGVDIALSTDSGLGRVLGHPQELEQVVLSVLANARDAIRDRHAEAPIGPPGVIVVTVRGTPGGRSVRIVLTDNGGGIPEKTLPNVFDPFFTTKDVGRGAGLGLSVGFGIVESMGGRIDVTNIRHPDGQPGARVAIELPTAGLSLGRGAHDAQ